MSSFHSSITVKIIIYQCCSNGQFTHIFPSHLSWNLLLVIATTSIDYAAYRLARTNCYLDGSHTQVQFIQRASLLFNLKIQESDWVPGTATLWQPTITAVLEENQCTSSHLHCELHWSKKNYSYIVEGFSMAAWQKSIIFNPLILMLKF